MRIPLVGRRFAHARLLWSLMIVAGVGLGSSRPAHSQALSFFKNFFVYVVGRSIRTLGSEVGCPRLQRALKTARA